MGWRARVGAQVGRKKFTHAGAQTGRLLMIAAHQHNFVIGLQHAVSHERQRV
jgi:hypothetical protein